MSSNINAQGKWAPLTEGDRDSTISTFVGGFECRVSGGMASEDDEIRIWEGVEEEDGTHTLQSHLSAEPPEDSKFLIEVEHNGGLVRERFAQDRDEAQSIARDEIARIERGYY